MSIHVLVWSSWFLLGTWVSELKICGRVSHLKCLWTSIPMVQCSSEEPPCLLTLVSTETNVRQTCFIRRVHRPAALLVVSLWPDSLFLISTSGPGGVWRSGFQDGNDPHRATARWAPHPHPSHYIPRATINVTDRFFWWSIDCWAAFLSEQPSSPPCAVTARAGTQRLQAGF